MGVSRHKTDFRHTYVYTYNVGTLANVDKLNYKDFLGCKFELIFDWGTTKNRNTINKRPSQAPSGTNSLAVQLLVQW